MARSPGWYSRNSEVNKKILQALAEARVADARALLHAKRFEAAYYLAGYAIECALKACIATKTKRYDFPDKKLACKVYTHNLEELAQIAGLKEHLQHRFRQDPAFETKWGIVKDWSEQARHDMISPQKEARRRANEMLNAVEDRQGILACIQQYW
jgi:hypothetical protein